MDYKRLTRKDDRGFYHYNCTEKDQEDCLIYENCGECYGTQVLYRLAELEDKIEQGTLIELKDRKMKAWLVREKDEFLSAVVFAETRGKARALAMCTDACEDSNFCDIEVRRLPQIDKYYKDGKIEMDWYNPHDRIILVKECGFQCESIEYADCEDCSAREFCDLYNDDEEELKE